MTADHTVPDAAEAATRTATAWDGMRPRIAGALMRAVVPMEAPMMTAKAWDHTETDKKGGASWERVRLYGKQI